MDMIREIVVRLEGKFYDVKRIDVELIYGYELNNMKPVRHEHSITS